MPDRVLREIGTLIDLLELASAGALVLGFVVATTMCLIQARREGVKAALDGYRQALGRAVLIGLEILVAATIIKTIAVEPTPEAMGQLAAMVAIRTVLGWTTALEINGRWPWQTKPNGAATSRQGSQPSSTARPQS